jgi:integrative and conjugative element protein (TIGR02256 family)
VTALALTQGQQLALRQLADQAAASGGHFEVFDEPTEDRGMVSITVAMDCADLPSALGGLPLRARERFNILLPAGFPIDHPFVEVPHTRFAGYPHVQWGRHLCLYLSPALEWDAADGMYGLIDRLRTWIERAAVGQLDPEGQPLHPPIAYSDGDAGVFVVRTNAPDAATGVYAGSADPSRASLHLAVCEQVHNGRFDLTDWADLGAWCAQTKDGPLDQHGHPMVGALAILLDRDMGFEYPTTVSALMDALSAAGVDLGIVLEQLASVAMANSRLALRRGQPEPPLHVVIGTPSRRPDGETRRQHLVCWRLDDLGQTIAVVAGAGPAVFDDWARVREDLLVVIPEWITSAKTAWVRVLEARPEVTIRRDVDSHAAWLREKRVLVLGCGALGAPIAEHCLRAGSTSVDVVDEDIVDPGILVRQPYADADIGSPKAHVLAQRLGEISASTVVTPRWMRAQHVVSDAMAMAHFDLIIDATANAAVATLIEREWAGNRSVWPPLISVAVGATARRGLVTASTKGSTGAARDLLRRLALLARIRQVGRLADVAHDFFPTEARTEVFQPEPGCSSPTFRGSAAELGALAGHLLDAGLGLISDEAPMAAAVVRLDALEGPVARGTDVFTWADDERVIEGTQGYEVRFATEAMKRIRAEARRAVRVFGSEIETGGMLFGQVDDACRCVWVDRAEGPPPDSLHRADEFVHGLDGVDELVAHHRGQSGGLSRYVGMWHTHPFGKAQPSDKDTAAMTTLVTQAADAPPAALVMIVGGVGPQWEAYLNGEGAPALFAAISRRPVGTARRRQAPTEAVASAETRESRRAALPRTTPKVRARRLRRWLWWR